MLLHIYQMPSTLSSNAQTRLLVYSLTLLKHRLQSLTQRGAWKINLEGLTVWKCLFLVSSWLNHLDKLQIISFAFKRIAHLSFNSSIAEISNTFRVPIPLYLTYFPSRIFPLSLAVWKFTVVCLRMFLSLIVLDTQGFFWLYLYFFLSLFLC